MKHLLAILSVLFLFSCSNNSDSGKETAELKKKKVIHIHKPNVPSVIHYDSLDVSIRDKIKMADSLYGKTPYYGIVNNQRVFIIMKGELISDYSKQFTGHYKYGIIDENMKPLLDCNYDKIYNPNMTMLNCMEIKLDNRIGLYDFTTGEILDPQFEYIMPSSQTPDNIAYGFKEDNWYKIEDRKKFEISKANFLPTELFNTLSYNVKDMTENLLFSTYSYEDSDAPIYGAGVAFTPSYIEHLNIIQEVCENVLLPEQRSDGFGTTELNVKTDVTRSIGDKIISFIVSFYNEGVDGRGYVENSKKVVVYNKENKAFSSQSLNHEYDSYDNFCHVEGYKFINDSLIEVLGRDRTDTTATSKGRYDFENSYSYRQITATGEIEELHSTRYYNFTKYFEIDETYFSGCYATWMTESDPDNNNVWVSDHLTLDDLDLMTNEIYADYGLKFKTAKWQTYFSQFNWYNPQYDNVDKFLSKIDKKNIEIIAKEKAKMKGKENDYVNKHKSAYYAAG